MTAQRYTELAAARMHAGNCPECGCTPISHGGWGGSQGCDLTEGGAASRLAEFACEVQ